MKIAIVGFGLEGRAAYDYWQSGNDITVCDLDSQVELPSGVNSQLGSNYLADLARFDMIVRSPGIHPRTLVEAASPSIIDKVTTNLNEFLQACPSKNVIGVTGTKGKGTTSTLIAKMLEADDKRTHLGGNIGVAPLDLIGKINADDWVVLELSNFQLIDSKYSPHIAVCLMVVPEHLDWHSDSDEYFSAKTQLFRHQTGDDIAIYNAGDNTSKRIASTGEAQKVPYMALPGSYVHEGQIKIDSQTVCRTNELRLPGEHNWQNACAAVTAVWSISQNLEAMRSVLTSFSGLEHRLELVREVDKVRYCDDSFGTTPQTAIVALKAFKQPKVLILGGYDKGADYDELAETVVANRVRSVLLIGEQATRIREALLRAGFTRFVMGGNSMHEIVNNAQAAAQPGDVVLLSPACASFDMFKNYKERGKLFKQAVQALA